MDVTVVVFFIAGVVVVGVRLVGFVVTWLIVRVVVVVASVLLFCTGVMLMSPLQRLEVQVQAYDEESTG